MAPDVATNLWLGAAEGGARAIGQGAGAIVAGKRADLVVLDAAELDFEALGAADRLAVAVFSGNSNRVRDVFVAGRKIVADRRHPREDEAAEAYRAALKRLRDRPGS